MITAIIVVAIFIILMSIVVLKLLLDNNDEDAMLIFGIVIAVILFIVSAVYINYKDSYFLKKIKYANTIYPIILTSGVVYFLFYQFRIRRYRKNKKKIM